MGLSRRAYARHRKSLGLPGGSESAVRKAIDTGRITLGADGLIDPGRADAEWDEVTDSAKQRGETAGQAETRPVATAAADPAPEPAADIGGGGAITFQKARTAEMAIRVQRAKLALQRERAELVSRAQAVNHVFSLARKERDSWLQLPARVAANMAAGLEVDAHAMEQALDLMIRDHLASLAEIRIELGST